MKHYLAKKTNEEDTIIESETNYLTENLDKIYYINFNHGITERD